MAADADGTEPQSVIRLAFGDDTPKQALMTALVVGTVLTAINHGDVVLAGMVPPVSKVALTYCVPYCVATWGAVTGKRARARQSSHGNPETP